MLRNFSFASVSAVASSTMGSFISRDLSLALSVHLCATLTAIHHVGDL